MIFTHNKIFVVLLLTVAITATQGCAGLVSAGVISATAIAADNRSLSQQLDDEAITLSMTTELNNKDKALLRNNNLHIQSNNNKVLLSGQIKTESERKQIVAIAAAIPDVIQVYDQLRIGPPISFQQRSQDSWLTTKVKTSMLEIEGLEPLNIKVITENAEVFLIGSVSRAEARKATEAARYVVGVDKVIKVFEYTD